MFGITKSKTYNATCVMALNDNNIALLKAMQMRHIDNIPKGANYIAFLDDGDACFLSEIQREPFTILMPQLHVVNFYTDVKVTI